jgi:hypothetical protein
VKFRLYLADIRSVPVTPEAEARQRQVWERLFAEEQTRSKDKSPDSQGVDDDENGRAVSPRFNV